MAEPIAKKAKTNDEALDTKCIDTIRVLSADVVQKSKSGHPGAPMGCAPMAYVLFNKIMNYNPSNPSWFNRDRFILSNGHGCALLYSMLHLTGYERPTMDDLKQFRQLHSVTAGHPENFLLEGVEVSTGPLGQGLSNGVGFAISESHLAATFNKPDAKIIDNYTYVICGDGCLQEGVTSEASSLAGHLKLGKLIVLYDDNNITIDGSTDLSFTEDVGKRYESYGWQVLVVEDGNTDTNAIQKAVEEAKACTDKPTLIKVSTIIGYGSAKEGTSGVHGAPLGDADIESVKAKFGMEKTEKFNVPSDVAEHMRLNVAKGEALQKEWEAILATHAEKYPELAKEIERRIKGDLPANWESVLPKWTDADAAIASRKTSGAVLNSVASILPELMGGSADLTPSNITSIKCSHDYQAATPDGRYMRFGVREHAMSAICNGMAAYGGVFPYCATFLNFAGYALGAMRLSALSQFRVLYIMTHDSIGLGEDGPTHQPIGMLLTLRSIPNMYVFRPCDGNEVAGSYKCAIEMKKSPSVFALSRQNLPFLPGTSAENVAKGGYVVHSTKEMCQDTPELIFVATGSEVSLALDAAKAMAGVAVNIVSMPCWKLFDKQSTEYKKSVFQKDALVISVEASSVEGWAKYSHFQIGLRTFGKSAPIKDVYNYFGLTTEKIAVKAQKVLDHFKGKSLTWLVDDFAEDL